MAKPLLSSELRLPIGTLIAADPGQLQTLNVPIQPDQGTLEVGTFITTAGQRALIANQTEGLLSQRVHTDEIQNVDATAIYTSGRFLLPQVRRSNPNFVFTDSELVTLRSKGITFEGQSRGATGWQ